MFWHQQLHALPALMLPCCLAQAYDWPVCYMLLPLINERQHSQHQIAWASKSTVACSTARSQGSLKRFDAAE